MTSVTKGATPPGGDVPDERGRTWTIRELADEFGVTTRTVRHYEDIGLISPERQGTTVSYTHLTLPTKRIV